ncbi:hypothetical protein NEPAR06_1549 [Nematocida parisii]|uniref:uncharacterized protein n=1 Tax=Nematocida parisii (strain ERTm1 / ATCC PRA-289) TaxID=881290 RepID=UPI000264B448|nr:uncharacterized protein NEPG_00277 [Nematocida parisii ERTm1]KAI5127764.1 hypothetical protein NEPAR08_1015 [Nematocida parisii]EIJ94753.1 hypothetical protein NEPG_00277 [Nematocida parisii ERTm1]KAI5128206.1 hypothetical protein NEPAR03_1214 [Nematocida parisii]KAI5155110.1 hypothetical protein NEPAR06_1549 [Nematocida parisii]KAI5158603.1 hypothetical protein NEPAR05_2132 [Nematocida parisii]|eukprot:XP_013058109.1 hypothetical protein NEPG_00277 [Nematocida parisii ERTm1]
MAVKLLEKVIKTFYYWNLNTYVLYNEVNLCLRGVSASNSDLIYTVMYICKHSNNSRTIILSLV